jgi:ABC-type Fe3+/spermidine/putrescine transport system ATPase subunit
MSAVLEVEGVRKQYGATTALRDVSLELNENEVLALLGDNGAGKSTLIKILSGVVKPDAGEIRIGGERVDIDSPHDARDLGIETVYQDLALFDNTGAVGNFFAGRERTSPRWLGAFGWVNDRAMRQETDELENKGTLAIVSGVPGSQVGIDRVDGVKEGLKKAGAKTKIVKEVTGQFDREQAVGAMEDILQTNPDVDAVLCVNDQMALGAIEAIAAHKKTDEIKLIGFDGALEATQKILAGDMFATIAQDPYGMAKVGVESALRKIEGKDVMRTVDTGAKLITQENARDYFEEVRGKLGGTGRGLER